ncbi:efflux RND transporter periplasmic adaptor subunit [Chitinophaga sp.]|uniref:efflux RND transporter periplasmic adaptor subunit n=1 Tax=Chitinophaga sp. TaxID=1869181 RepID=UPI002F93B3E5
MTRRVLYLILPALLLACKGRNKDKEAEKPAAISVKIATVTPAAVNNEVAVSGNIEGNTTVRLGFMVAGKINYISNSEGQPVRSGQLIASLDPSNYAIAKNLADVQVNNATDEYNRLKILHDRKSLSESDFSKIGFTLQQARLQLQAQQKNLSDTRLYSPINGVLLKKQAEVGEIVSVGMPLFVIADISKVKVLAYVPESDLRNIRIGQYATVMVNALDKKFSGKVTEVGAAADATSRAFTVKIELPNPGNLIRPGMIAEARIATGGNKEAILLPAEAVQKDVANQSYVYVADKIQGKAFKRRVSLGNIADNKIEVLSGLSAGDLVVVSGNQKLSDGATIAITQ